MRILFRITIVIVVALLGVAIYTTLRSQTLIPAVPPLQVEKSTPLLQVEKSAPSEKLPTPLDSELPRAEQPAARFEEVSDEEPVPDTTDLAPDPENAASPLPDWRTDDETARPQSSDLWQQEDMSMKFVEWDGLSEDKQLSILEKGLLQQYGDTPAVRTVIDFQNKPKHLPTPIDDAIVLAEAFLELWPSEKARQNVIELKRLKADGFEGFPGARPAP